MSIQSNLTSVLQQYMSVASKESSFLRTQITSYYCMSRKNFDLSVTCPYFCCYQNYVDFYYPYCCLPPANNSDPWKDNLWKIIVFPILVVLVSIGIVVLIQFVKRKKNQKSQTRYYPVGVQPNMQYRQGGASSNNNGVVSKHLGQQHNYQPPNQSYQNAQIHKQHSPVENSEEIIVVPSHNQLSNQQQDVPLKTQQALNFAHPNQPVNEQQSPPSVEYFDERGFNNEKRDI